MRLSSFLWDDPDSNRGAWIFNPQLYLLSYRPAAERRQPCAHAAWAKPIDEAVMVFVWDLLASLLTSSSTSRHGFEPWYTRLERVRLTTTSPAHSLKEPYGPASGIWFAWYLDW